MILVSSCLFGLKCRYDGKEMVNQSVMDYLKDKEYILVCPEQMGGLATPRPPAEIISKSPLKIVNNINEDVTIQFETGVKEIEKIIKNKKIDLAILKSKSPSCGSKVIYDGSFSGTLISGKGIFAEALESKNIKVINEEEV